MTRSLALALVLVTVRVAEAQTVDEHLARARAAQQANDLEGAKRELLAAYAIEARPELLFALGQVELNLGHYEAAVDYYEQFIATDPAADQVSLAQQAIGAARLRMSEPPPAKPAPPPPPPPRMRYGPRWDLGETIIASLGVVVGVSGALVLRHGRLLDYDETGTQSEYEDRQSRSLLEQYAGGIAIGIGAAAVLGAFVHWRLEDDELGFEPVIEPNAAGVVMSGRW